MLHRITIESPLLEIFVIVGLFILVTAASFALFTFGYYLITIILITFFEFVLPFSWWYSFGAWLIFLVIGFFIAPGLFITNSRRKD